ncbi:hypothetical protein FRC12_009822 [Ceratobasidium sp. 428]|nr:hypothetical protein FRC09_012032 [Ceratobasidium sp. 395]KAG8759223.1 hypothetical protein FRC12_009822 [Ceratobasidium sp. 428]
MELFSFAGKGSIAETLPGAPKPNACFEIDYLAETSEPIVSVGGPRVLPSKTFEEVTSKQFDIILIPGGPTARPDQASKAVNDFISKQVTNAKYVLTVCTGSWLLSGSGVLDGKRATTNKFTFNEVKRQTSTAINWVPKARWVVDGNIWTSSGVTAGQDMAFEFLKSIAGEEFAKFAKNVIELRATDADDDEFAGVYGLV